MEFITKLFNKFINWLSSQTTEEKLYNYLRMAITDAELHQIENIVKITVNQLMTDSELTNQQKRDKAFAEIQVAIQDLGDSVKRNVTSSIINFLIEKAVVAIKIGGNNV